MRPNEAPSKDEAHVEGAGPSRASKLRTTIVRALGFAAAIAILIAGFYDVDFSRAWSLITSIGGAVVLIVVPYLAAMSVDTIGWRRIFQRLDLSLPFASLLRIRLSAEAVLMSMFAGALVAETLKPWLLQRRHKVPWSKSLASLAARKRQVVFANGLYMLLGLAVGWMILRQISEPLIGFSGLPYFTLIAALLLLSVPLGIGEALRRGVLAGELHQLLVKLPLGPLRRWLGANQQGFTQTDAEMSRAFGGGALEFAVNGIFFLTSWFLESVETYLILYLLGAPISFAAALVMEMVLSLVRSLVFVLPAGLGVQDVGYAAFLRALAVPEAAAIGAAFVILKRGKELFWIGVGYVALFLEGGRPSEMQAAGQEAV